MPAILLTLLAGLVLALGLSGYMQAGDPFLSALYKTLSLFVLNYEAPASEKQNGLIEAARLLAAGLFAAAVVYATARGVWRQTVAFVSARMPRRYVILGHGHLARQIAQRLRIAEPWAPIVTIANGVTEQQQDDAGRDWIALIDGDPSDPRRLRQAGARRARRIFVALDDDLATLDAAEAALAHLSDQPAATRPEIRTFVRDTALSRLPGASATGYMTRFGSVVHSLRTEAARTLVATARLDRIALLLGQARVHAVIVGCGGQGRALLEEVLKQDWRIDLGPPAVTVIDPDADKVRERLALDAPLLMAEGPGSVAAMVDGWQRPSFVAGDILSLDFATSKPFRAAIARHGPVTAWIVACPDESVALRASLRLHGLMTRRDLPAAGIHVRIWSKHAGPAQSLASRRIAMVRSFGSADDGLVQSEALADDPDRVPRRLNLAYDRAAMAEDGPDERQRWARLPEWKRESNRSLYRNAQRKLEDLGLEVKRQVTSHYVSPAISGSLAAPLLSRLISADYASRHPEAPGPELLSAMREHDRFVVERTLMGWRPGAARDDSRMLSPYLCPWSDIPDDALSGRVRPGSSIMMTNAESVRRCDAALLTGLLEAGISTGPATGPHCVPACRAIVDLGGDRPACSRPPGEMGPVSTLVLLMPAAVPTPEEAEAIRSMVARVLGQPSLAWITLVFRWPPQEGLLGFAESLCPPAALSDVRVETVWGWTEDGVLPGIARMELEARSGSHPFR